MGFPPNAVLLEPNTRSRHGLEWSRSDARRSDPTEWAGPVNIKACEYAEPNEVVGNVSRRYAARHVPVCLSARGSRDRQGSARAVKPLRLQDVHAMALKTLQEMEHTKKLTRIADAWPDELALPTATAERAKKRLLMTFSPPEPASSVVISAVPSRTRMLPPLESRPSSAPAPPSPSMIRRHPGLRAATPPPSPLRAGLRGGDH